MSGHMNWDHKDKDKERMFREFMKMLGGMKETGKDSTDMVQNYLPSPTEFMDALTLQKFLNKDDPPEKAMLKQVICSTVYKTTADMARKILEDKQPPETIITALPDLDGFGTCVMIDSSVDPEMSEFVKNAFIVMKQQTGSMLLSVLHGKDSEKSRAIIEAEMKKIQDYLANPNKVKNEDMLKEILPRLPRITGENLVKPVKSKEIDIYAKPGEGTLTAEEARELAKKFVKDMGY